MDVEWRMIYCAQSRFGMPVSEVTNSGCLIANGESFVDIISPSNALIREERLDIPSCQAKYLDVRVLKPDGAVINSFPLDARLPENRSERGDLIAGGIDQVANAGCYVISVKVAPDLTESLSNLEKNKAEFEIMMTPKVIR